MARQYHEGNRHFQDQFDTRRLADRMQERIIHSVIGDGDREFIERADMFFLATADAAGQPECSYKGGDPGFVQVTGASEVAFPNYDGNGMYLSMGNLRANPKVGMLFIDFEGQRRLRLNGTATIDADDPLLAAYPEAQFIVRVRASEIFPNCPRYIHKYQLVERSQFVPHAACETPIPAWKRGTTFADALPAPDRARLGEEDAAAKP